MAQYNNSGESSEAPTGSVPIVFPLQKIPGRLNEQGSRDTPFQTSWGINGDVVMQMQRDGCWEEVKHLADAAQHLFAAVNAFKNKTGSLWPDCFEEMMASENIVRYKMKGGGELPRWHKSMALRHRTLISTFIMFLDEARDNGLEFKVLKAFNAHKKPGVHGDGVMWWNINIEDFLGESRKLLLRPTTLEMLLEGNDLWDDNPTLNELQIYADALDSDPERGEGVYPISQLVFVVRRETPRIIKLMADMTWVSKRISRGVSDVNSDR